MSVTYQSSQTSQDDKERTCIPMKQRAGTHEIVIN